MQVEDNISIEPSNSFVVCISRLNTMLSDTTKAKLEEVQDTATNIILPNLDCSKRLSALKCWFSISDTTLIVTELLG